MICKNKIVADPIYPFDPIYQEKKGLEFQYILTLNRDKIETEERQKQINLKIDDHKRASFDRRNTFLTFKYKEI